MGLKMAQCIRSNDFNCLGGIYDQGWGMVDGMHAVVFVDNHDNQRGQGGCSLHAWPRLRLQENHVLLLLPGHRPGPTWWSACSFPNACGNGWTCEHWWSSIMNMAQFANKVIGQPVTNWDASGTTLGFARGNVGFLALGDLGKEFNTGLPDGEYCDIIRDCSQKIQISGGRGYFQSPDQDPVVAICVGC